MPGVTRILVGTLAAYHGAQKLLIAFSGLPEGTSVAIIGIAGGMEVLGGALMAVGVLRRSRRMMARRVDLAEVRSTGC